MPLAVAPLDHVVCARRRSTLPPRRTRSSSAAAIARSSHVGALQDCEHGAAVRGDAERGLAVPGRPRGSRHRGAVTWYHPIGGPTHAPITAKASSMSATDLASSPTTRKPMAEGVEGAGAA